MLGSHNSFSYLKPTKWWMRLFTTWAKCQDKTIIEQYNAGVRYFDIRIAFKKDGSVRLVHNLVDYHPTNLFEALRTLKNKPDVYLRILLDMRKKPRNAEDTAKVLQWFYSFIDYVMQDSVATIDKAIIFWNWKHIIDAGANVTECHASVSAKWYEYILGTKRWARKHNQEVMATENNALKGNGNVLLLDYV